MTTTDTERTIALLNRGSFQLQYTIFPHGYYQCHENISCTVHLSPVQILHMSRHSSAFMSDAILSDSHLAAFCKKAKIIMGYWWEGSTSTSILLKCIINRKHYFQSNYLMSTFLMKIYSQWWWLCGKNRTFLLKTCSIQWSYCAPCICGCISGNKLEVLLLESIMNILNIWMICFMVILSFLWLCIIDLVDYIYIDHLE